MGGCLAAGLSGVIFAGSVFLAAASRAAVFFFAADEAAPAGLGLAASDVFGAAAGDLADFFLFLFWFFFCFVFSAAPFTGVFPEELAFGWGAAALFGAAGFVADLAASSAQAGSETSTAQPRASSQGLTNRDIFFQRLGIFFSTPGRVAASRRTAVDVTPTAALGIARDAGFVQ